MICALIETSSPETGSSSTIRRVCVASALAIRDQGGAVQWAPERDNKWPDGTRVMVRGADGFIRMTTNLALLLAPDKADGLAAPEFAARRLVANAAIEACVQYVQLWAGSLASEDTMSRPDQLWQQVRPPVRRL
jgi:hypothetical protein